MCNSHLVALPTGGTADRCAVPGDRMATGGKLVYRGGPACHRFLLPDQLTIPLLWLGLAMSLTGLTVSPAASIIGALAGYLSLWSVYHLFRLLTGKEGMGYGDFKLLAALGAWLGWQKLPLIILFSSLVGAVVGVTLLLLKRHKSGQAMPFGPYIAAAGWLAWIWGEDMIDFYIRASGL